jgi:hypothetical protein
MVLPGIESLMRDQQLTLQAKHNLAVNIKIRTFWDVEPCTPSMVVRYQATGYDTLLIGNLLKMFWQGFLSPSAVKNALMGGLVALRKEKAG